MTNIPAYDQLMNPTIQALRALGGSGGIEEIYLGVAKLMSLDDEQMAVLHDPEKGSQTEIEYRLAWARTYLKKFGVLETSSRGIWALTADGRLLESVDPRKVQKFVRDLDSANRTSQNEPTTESDQELKPAWRDETMNALLEMDPPAFERLIQRMLRESGFIQVEVTGRSGDGGIDGKGIMRLGGLMSFHVIFQCKRYKGTISPSHIRDFRGAMVGRADKGIFVTTGNFSRDSLSEATRDGAPAIDLMDGDQLVDKLKELGLGIKSQKIEVEQILVDKMWFKTI